MARAIAFAKDLREMGYSDEEIFFEMEDAGYDDFTIGIAIEMA